MVATVAPHFGLPLHSVGRVLHCNDSYSTGVSALVRIAERTRKPTLSILSKRCANSHRRRRRRRRRRRSRRHTHTANTARLLMAFATLRMQSPHSSPHIYTRTHTLRTAPHLSVCRSLAHVNIECLESVKNVDAACGDGARPEHSGASFFFTHQYLLLLRQHTRTHALAYTSMCISTAYCALCVRYHAKPSLFCLSGQPGPTFAEHDECLIRNGACIISLYISAKSQIAKKNINETSKLCALKTG